MQRITHCKISFLQIKIRGIWSSPPFNLYRTPNCSGSRNNIIHPPTKLKVTETQICLLFHLEIDAVVRRTVFRDHAMNLIPFTYFKSLQNLLHNWNNRQYCTSAYLGQQTGRQKIIIIFINCSWLSPGDSGYFTCKQNMKLVNDKFRFKSGGLHEKLVVATWSVGSHLSIRL